MVVGLLMLPLLTCGESHPLCVLWCSFLCSHWMIVDSSDACNRRPIIEGVCSELHALFAPQGWLTGTTEDLVATVMQVGRFAAAFVQPHSCQ